MAITLIRESDMRTGKFLLTGILTLFILMLFSLPAFGQQKGIMLTISPIKSELTADKNTTVVTEVTLRNSGASSVAIQASTQDFIADDASGRPLFVEPEESAWSMSTWITAQPAQFNLDPGQKKTVKIFIKVPKNAEPGGHYAAAFFQSIPTSAGQTGIAAKLGSLFLLNVSGDIVEKGSIDFLRGPLITEPKPTNFEVGFNNTGNVHIKPMGSLRIRQWGGSLAAKLDLGNENVLPRSSRTFRAKWKKPPTFGLFFVKANIEYGESTKTVTSSRKVILVMPWKQVLVGLLIFAVGLGSGVIPRRRRKESAVVETASKNEPEDEASAQCEAIKADGQRCMNQAKPGSKYCGIAAHKKLSSEGQD